jgi:glycosyltransferase involved in cell wall biosynthesis
MRYNRIEKNELNHMYILLIHQAFVTLDQAGGTRHHEMASYLAEHGHRVTIITSPISYLTGKAENKPGKSEVWKAQENGGSVRIIRTYVYPSLHRSFFHRVLAFFSFMVSSFLAGLQVRQVDLVWGTSPPIFQGVTAWMLASLKHKPFLFEVRDLWPAFAVQVGVLKQPVLIRMSEWLERFLYRHADQVMVNSPGFVKHVTEHGARNVQLVPNGSDTNMFNPKLDGDSFRQGHGLEGKCVVLYAGAHGVSNDLGVLLEAARTLNNQKEILFVLLGDGKEKPALQAQARAMGLNNVVFFNPIPKAEMPTAVSASDVCVAILKPIPLYATVYPNKVFDYMAAGKPVVLAINGVIRQVLEEARAGIPVTPGDSKALAEAILKLARHPEERQMMGSQGRFFVEKHFDRAVIAQKLENLMFTIAKGSKPNRENSL